MTLIREPEKTFLVRDPVGTCGDPDCVECSDRIIIEEYPYGNNIYSEPGHEN